MKKTLLASMIVASLSTAVAFAADEVKTTHDASAEVSKDVSHNALTGNTTTTTVKKLAIARKEAWGAGGGV